MADAIAPSAHGGRLTLAQGSALYVGAVLGTGVIALPALAAEAAGPASLLAWLGLVLLSIPLAATFAALGARYADSGGVATYARKAFGDRAAAVVGWCFFFAVPFGGPASVLFGGAYVAAALGGGRGTAEIAAAVMMAGVALANAFGVHITGRVQLALSGLLVAFLVAAIALSLPHARLDNLRPFAPHGWLAIGPSAVLLVWAFVGWEAVTHLAAEFRRPDRDLPRATAVAVTLIAVLYLALAFATVVVLGSAAATTEAPLGELVARGVGGNARMLAAVPAVLLTLGTMNAYYAGAAKLGAALGRDRAFPGWFSRGSLAGAVPRRSLGLVVALSAVVLLVVSITNVTTHTLVLLTNGLFVSVYVVGVAAAVRLLPRGWARVAALVSLVSVVGLLALDGAYLLWPAVVACGALLYRRMSEHRRARRATDPARDELAAAEAAVAEAR